MRRVAPIALTAAGAGQPESAADVDRLLGGVLQQGADGLCRQALSYETHRDPVSGARVRRSRGGTHTPERASLLCADLVQALEASLLRAKSALALSLRLQQTSALRSEETPAPQFTPIQLNGNTWCCSGSGSDRVCRTVGKRGPKTGQKPARKGNITRHIKRVHLPLGQSTYRALLGESLGDWVV